jgi:hypothetical protein
MSQYTRLRVALEVADNPSFVAPTMLHAVEDQPTATLCQQLSVVAPSGAPLEIDFAAMGFTSIAAVLIASREVVSAAYTTLGWASSAGASTVRLLDGGAPLLINDFDPATVLSLEASADTKLCLITIVGS